MGGVKRGMKGYGKAKKGSAQAKRLAKANQWVKDQIVQLIGVIKDIGQTNQDGMSQVTFGVLFVAYETISDTLVGILQRSKKYNLLSFQGEMLWQGASDQIMITLKPAADT